MNKQGIFTMWLKNFCALVFTQSFQAIFMCFIVLIIATVIEKEITENLDVTSIGDFITGGSVTFDNDGKLTTTPDPNKGMLITTIIAYIGVTGVIKLDKLVRKIFGVEDSELLGDLGKGMRELMHSAMHLKNFGQRVTGGLKEIGNAGADLASKTATRRNIQNNQSKINQLAKGTPTTIDVKGLNSGDKKNGSKNDSFSLNVGSSGLSREQLNKLFSDPNFNPDDLNKTMGERMLDDARRDEDEAAKRFRKSTIKGIGNVATGTAAMLLANGGSDNLEEAATVADRMHALGSSAINNIVDDESGIRKLSKDVKAGVRSLDDYYDDRVRQMNENIEKESKVKVNNMKNSTSGVEAYMKANEKYVNEVNKSYNEAAKNVESAASNASKSFKDNENATKNYNDTVSKNVNNNTKSANDASKKIEKKQNSKE